MIWVYFISQLNQEIVISQHIFSTYLEVFAKLSKQYKQKN